MTQHVAYSDISGKTECRYNRLPTAAAAFYSSHMQLRLREIRKDKGLTQRDVADRAGISLSYYTEIENGKKRVNSQRMPAIAKALGVPVADLFQSQKDPLIQELTLYFSDLPDEHKKTVMDVARSLRAASRKD